MAAISPMCCIKFRKRTVYTKTFFEILSGFLHFFSKSIRSPFSETKFFSSNMANGVSKASKLVGVGLA
jgi:hypothetical protein